MRNDTYLCIDTDIQRNGWGGGEYADGEVSTRVEREVVGSHQKTPIAHEQIERNTYKRQRRVDMVLQKTVSLFGCTTIRLQELVD